MSSIRFASYQFLFGCAFLTKNNNYPFSELRKLTIEERIEERVVSLKKMTFQQIFNLEFTHKHCQKKAQNLKNFLSKKK